MNMCEQDDISEFLILPSTSFHSEENETYKWNHNSTLLFLDLYEEYRKQVGSLKVKNLKKMFEEIAKELRHKTQQQVTGANCENRWKHLERSYKKYIDNNNKTGRARKDFQYAEVMEKILGKKKNIRPVLLLSSETVKNIPNSLEEENIVENTANENHQPQKRSTSTKKKNRLDVLKEIRNERKEFYRKYLDLEEKKVLLKEREVIAREKRNQILEKYLNKGNPESEFL